MTKNEEKNISACLSTLSRFDQIFVIDSNSSDGTQGLAGKLGAIVIPFTWNGKYPKKKQWCLENLPFKHEWVLYIDADERMTEDLATEINKIINLSDKAKDGYFIGFNYVFQGSVLKYGHKIYKLILLKRTKAKFFDYDDLDVPNMWEVEGHYQPKIDGRVGSLKGKAIHNDHKNLFVFFEKINRYTDWEAILRMKGKIRSPNQATIPLRRLLQSIFDALPNRASFIFIYTYIIKLGFMDGKPGLDYARMLSIYHTMITMKINEKKRANE